MCFVLRSTTRLQLIRGGTGGILAHFRSSLLSANPTTVDSVIPTIPHSILSTHILASPFPFPLFLPSLVLFLSCCSHTARWRCRHRRCTRDVCWTTKIHQGDDLRQSWAAMAWRSSILTVSQYTSYRFPRGRQFGGFLISYTQINLFQYRTETVQYVERG